MASAWDQNAFNSTSSPAAAAIEAIAESWLIELLGLPDGCATSFTTGASLANFSALAAARWVQDEGICWCGPTEWRGRTAMRISVSNWATRERDVERSLDSILRAARTATC